MKHESLAFRSAKKKNDSLLSNRRKELVLTIKEKQMATDEDIKEMMEDAAMQSDSKESMVHAMADMAKAKGMVDPGKQWQVYVKQIRDYERNPETGFYGAAGKKPWGKGDSHYAWFGSAKGIVREMEKGGYDEGHPAVEEFKAKKFPEGYPELAEGGSVTVEAHICRYTITDAAK